LHDQQQDDQWYPFHGIVDHHIHARPDEREVIARVIIERPTATQMFVPAIIRVLARD